jgi:kynurenine 3-monooxygenase
MPSSASRPAVASPKSAVGTRNTNSQDDTIVMVGAGLCGALAAIMLADRGYNIDIYERREEAHLFADSGRSFNITLTERGFRALRMVGLDEKVMKAGMKCHGRHVHDAKNKEKEPEKTFWTSYGTNIGTDFLLSISRVKLNKILLQEMVLRSDKIRITYGRRMMCQMIH